MPGSLPSSADGRATTGPPGPGWSRQVTARRQREVLVLRYWSHLGEAQIADTLGLSRGALKSTASRALVALRRELQAPR